MSPVEVSGTRADASLSIGILGAGEITAGSHLPALLALEGARVAWVADADPGRARLLAASYGVDWAALPERPEDLPQADVVLLAIPYGARGPYFRALGERGSAAYVEKPFALSLREHDAICSLFPPERLACGLQRRSGAAARVLRELVRSSLFGRLRSIRIEFGSPGVRTGGRYSSRLDLAGGGILVETGVHPIDLALHVTRASEAEVVAVRMVRHAGFDIHTEASLRIRGDAGVEAGMELLVSQLRFTSMSNVFAFETADVAMGSFGEGAVEIRPRGDGARYLLAGPDAAYPVTPAQMFHAHWSRFLDGVRTGTVNPTCAVESRVTTSVIDQLYARSAA